MFYLYYSFYLKTSRRRNLKVFLGSYDSIYLTLETHSLTSIILCCMYNQDVLTFVVIVLLIKKITLKNTIKKESSNT